MAEKQKPEHPETPTPAGTPEGPDHPAPLGEIEQGPSKVDQFLEAHLKKLLILLSLAVIGSGIYIVLKGLKDANEVNAGEALVSAKDPGGFRNVIKEYPGTAAAGTAQLQLARSLWEEGNNEDAKTTLRNFITDTPDHPALPVARMALASFLQEEGENELALDHLRAVADDPKAGYLAPLALIRVSEFEQTSGDLEAARKTLERANDPNDNNSFLSQNLVQNRLDTLGVDLPATVPKPKPPPPKIDVPLLAADAPDSLNTPTDPAPEPAPAPTPEPAPAPTPE
ncbi:MAG: tetratricopeptide repeat protein, partial [Verrucomicrobiota bacterium]|nr:tetratricopeptide repeat protein [Verrucomicrobiota bacterium]